MAVLSIALLPDLVEAAGDHNAGRLTGRLPEEASDGPGHDVGVLAPGGDLGTAHHRWDHPGVYHCFGLLITLPSNLVNVQHFLTRILLIISKLSHLHRPILVAL